MIISDLNYLENTSEEIFGGISSFLFNKAITTNVASATNFASNNVVNDVFNKTANIAVVSRVVGNSSSLAFDNEAVGPNSNTQGTLNQITVAGSGSSQNGVFVSAAN